MGGQMGSLLKLWPKTFGHTNLPGWLESLRGIDEGHTRALLKLSWVSWVRVLPSSPIVTLFGTIARSAANRRCRIGPPQRPGGLIEASLRVFLKHPGVPVDTNAMEREIRPVVGGRKNWLFCWTEVGARYAGVLQSLVSTSRLQDVDPPRF